MPIFDFQCRHCGFTFEFILIKTTDRPICPNCGSQEVEKVFSMIPAIRMDSDSILKSLPDPQPPLEELRGKGTQGYQDKPEASTRLKDYDRTKDKHGNTIWKEKKRLTIDLGKNTKKYHS